MKKESKSKIAVVGLSHLGIVTSLGFALLKNPTIGIDTNLDTVSKLQKRSLPVYEPGLGKLLQTVQRYMEFSLDFAKLSDIKCVFFSQDTETDGSGSISILNEHIDKSIPYLAQGVSIVCMSQVPVGFYRELKLRIENRRPDLIFNLYHLVDTIIMTNAIERFIHPERIIIGRSDGLKPISTILQRLLKQFSCPVFYMSYESAELTKAAINLYLANSVSFANTLSDFCEQTGADINEIIPALQTDKRIGLYTYIRPSLKIAGGHLERDLLMLKRLADQKKMSSGVVKYILTQNRERYKWCENQLNNFLFNKIKNPTICIWGLSYKKNTDSTTRAVSIDIIKKLSKKARIKVYDPMANLPGNLSNYLRFNDRYEALENADCLLILTEWDEFKKIEKFRIKKLMKNYLIIDAVNILRSKKEYPATIQYIAMGVGKLA